MKTSLFPGFPVLSLLASEVLLQYVTEVCKQYPNLTCVRASTTDAGLSGLIGAEILSVLYLPHQ